MGATIKTHFREEPVFHALCINDAVAGRGLARLSGAGRANLIFLKPGPEDWARLRPGFHSIAGSRSKPCATSESRWESFATDIRSLTGKARRRRSHTNPLLEVGFCAGDLRVQAG